MALSQLIASTLMQFKADTSDLKKNVKEMTGLEKEHAQSALKTAEAQNKKYEMMAKALTRFNAIQAVATAAIRVAGDAWKKYEKAAIEAGGADAAKARKFRSALNEMSGAMDKVQIALGKVVVALEPLVRLAARLLSFAADAVSWLADRAASFVGERRWWETGATAGSAPRIGQAFRDAQALALVQSTNTIAALGLIEGASMNVVERTKVKRGPARKRQRPTITAEDRGGYTGGDTEFAGLLLGDTEGLGAPQMVTLASGLYDQADQIRGQRKSIAEAIFGPLDQFDSYQAAFETMGESISVFTGALQVSFGAWISGSMTLKEALSKVVGDTLSGIASKLWAHGIEHSLAALGSLAFQDYRGAAQHGVAAAAYAAGAALVGGAARQWNISHAPVPPDAPASAGAGGGYSGAGGGGGASEQRPVTIIVGDVFAANNPRTQRKNLARAIRSARRELN